MCSRRCSMPAGTVLDSSPMYGRAEGVVGQLLKEARDHKRAFLATKVWTRGRAAGIAQMERSLELMGTDRIDLMQVHNLLDWRVASRHARGLEARRPHALCRRHALHQQRLRRTRRGDGDRRPRFRAAELLARRSRRRNSPSEAGAGPRHRRAGQPPVRRRLARPLSRPRDAARLRARDRMRELVAAAADLHSHASRRHLHHPRHRQSRAHGRRRQSRRRRSTPTPATASSNGGHRANACQRFDQYTDVGQVLDSRAPSP